MLGLVGIILFIILAWAIWTSDSKEAPRHTKTYYSDLNHTVGKGATKVYKYGKRKYNDYKFRKYTKGE